MPNFTIDGRAQIAGDILRTWKFELIIPNLNDIAANLFTDQDDQIVRVNNVTVPSRGVEAIERQWGGFKEYFPGKLTSDNVLTVGVKEFEDMKFIRFCNDWRNAIINQGPQPDSQVGTNLSPNAGSSFYRAKRAGLAKQIYLRIYKYDGSLCPYQFKFLNAWLQNMDALTFDNGSGDGLTYSISFQFDYWDLEATA